MFNIHMLPADHGDCLWVEYGTGNQKYRILIDGGTTHSFNILADRIKDFPEEILNFELFIITHVDADHIGGSLKLLRNFNRLGKKIIFGDVWFNGWRHLNDALGDKQGELVTYHLKKRKLPWNKAFDGRTVVVPDDGAMPTYQLPGGMRLTLLSPSRKKLNKLRDRWEKTITEAELILGNVQDDDKYFDEPLDILGDDTPDSEAVEQLAETPFTKDKAVANGSSIAFLAEYEDEEGDKSCLFTGDAHVDIIVASIKRLIATGGNRIINGRLKIDALKVSHHGSKNNISKELLDLLDCSKFLFSTNGQQFSHPDAEAVARVIKFGRADDLKDLKLFFNYKSDFNKIWENKGLQYNFDYETEYPLPEFAGLRVEL